MNHDINLQLKFEFCKVQNHDLYRIAVPIGAWSITAIAVDKSLFSIIHERLDRKNQMGGPTWKEVSDLRIAVVEDLSICRTAGELQSKQKSSVSKGINHRASKNGTKIDYFFGLSGTQTPRFCFRVQIGDYEYCLHSLRTSHPLSFVFLWLILSKCAVSMSLSWWTRSRLAFENWRRTQIKGHHMEMMQNHLISILYGMIWNGSSLKSLSCLKLLVLQNMKYQKIFYFVVTSVYGNMMAKCMQWPQVYISCCSMAQWT